MNFAGAVFALQRGHKVKRHHWTGYWYIKSITLVDEGGKACTRDTIMMHTFNGEDIDIRDTNDILYTMSSCACDDWEIVKDWNKKTEQPDRYYGDK